jgi:heme-degrading monooxygenase HmoA
MPLISITRLHVRSVRYLPSFVAYTYRSTRQVKRSAGFVHGQLAVEWPRGFWTITAWETAEAMRAFRNAEPHLTAMRKLLTWCDESSFMHYPDTDATLPSCDEAHARMVSGGRVSKVLHPSPAHQAGKTAGARAPVGGPVLHPTGSA